MKWQQITTINDVLEAVELSNEKVVVLFKHSTRCSVSSMAKKVLENQWNFDAKVEPFFLDLLQYRTVSDFIATHLGVAHESPQMIVLRHGKVVRHESHMNVGVDPIRELA